MVPVMWTRLSLWLLEEVQTPSRQHCGSSIAKTSVFSGILELLATCNEQILNFSFLVLKCNGSSDVDAIVIGCLRRYKRLGGSIAGRQFQKPLFLVESSNCQQHVTNKC